MDYQPTNQPMYQGTERNASGKTWYLIGIVVVIAALAAWYFYASPPTAGTGTSAIEQTEIPALTGGDTTADISADLGQIPDTSAALDADAAASAADISGL